MLTNILTFTVGGNVCISKTAVSQPLTGGKMERIRKCVE